LKNKYEYIRQNRVEAGLAQRLEDYPGSPGRGLAQSSHVELAFAGEGTRARAPAPHLNIQIKRKKAKHVSMLGLDFMPATT